MQQTVRVDFDAKPGATQMPIDNVGEYTKETTDKLEVASVRDIRADRLEEPQRGVHGVVLRRLPGIRKAVGQHAAIHMAREGLQDAAGNLETSAGQSQARQGNHGVAAPVAEPGVTRDYSLLLASGNDVLLAGGMQRPGKIVVDRRAQAGFPAPGYLIPPVYGGGSDISPLSRSDDGSPVQGHKIKTQHARIEQIFLGVESAFEFHYILETAIPVSSILQSCGVVRQKQGRQAGVRRKASYARLRIESFIESVILKCQAVIAAKSEQWAKFQPDGARLASAFE